MKSPWANVSLLIILVTLVVTGYMGLINGQEKAAWRLWLHGIAAYALIVIFIWKSSIILHAYRRKKRWTRQRVMFIVMLFMLLGTVMMGLLWTLNGPLSIGGFSLVSLHIYVAVPVMLIVVWHVRRMKFIFKVKGTLGRRLFLGAAMSAVAASLLWRSAEWGKEALAWAGAERRFTGSYERDSFTGQFPSVSWMFDDPAPIEKANWSLTIDGAVRQPVTMRYEALLAMPSERREVLLDCTGGWYTRQVWEGVRIKDVLARAGVLDTAESITVRAISKYQRRFTLADADHMLLAYKVAGAPLTHGHGAPLRLVIPDRRGVEWVKWITSIHVNTTSARLQAPLPLR